MGLEVEIWLAFPKKTDGIDRYYPRNIGPLSHVVFHLSLRDPPTPVGVGNIGLLSKCVFPCVTRKCSPTNIFTLFEPLAEMFQHGCHHGGSDLSVIVYLSSLPLLEYHLRLPASCPESATIENNESTT